MQNLALSYGQDLGSGVLPAFIQALQNGVQRGKSRFLYFLDSEQKSFEGLEELPMAPRSMIFYFAALTGQQKFSILPPFFFSMDDAAELQEEFSVELLSTFNETQHCVVFNLFENIQLDGPGN